EVHTFLYNAFEFRVRQALEGRPHAGPLPQEQMEYLAHMDRMPRYVIDRLRQHSYILEPNSRVDPYRVWVPRSELDKALAELADVHDKKEIIERVTRLLKGLGKKQKEQEDRARILNAGLNEDTRVSDDLAK